MVPKGPPLSVPGVTGQRKDLLGSVCPEVAVGLKELGSGLQGRGRVWSVYLGFV